MFDAIKNFFSPNQKQYLVIIDGDQMSGKQVNMVFAKLDLTKTDVVYVHQKCQTQSCQVSQLRKEYKVLVASDMAKEAVDLAMAIEATKVAALNKRLKEIHIISSDEDMIGIANNIKQSIDSDLKIFIQKNSKLKRRKCQITVEFGVFISFLKA